jgi:riboflavin kinase/FMN adenylyltransferase
MSLFKVLRSTDDWEGLYGPSKLASVVSIGNFDGLHLGHQKILRQVVDRAPSHGALAVALTFDPHPLKILRPEEAPPLIQTLEQKIAGFISLGLDAAVVLNFNQRLASLSPEEFVRRTLFGPLRSAEVLVGHSFRFGHKQAGNAETLQNLGRRFGFGVEIIEPVIVDGEVVSSSLARIAIGEGRVARASQLLGRPFALTGPVQPGFGRGREMHFPTLNLAPQQELLPKPGVYATETLVRDHLYRSATNVGIRPTFDGRQLTVESHLFDFSETITAEQIEVRFWERLRDEQKFSGPEELRRQIAVDLEQTREFFRGLDFSAAERRTA